VGNLDSIPGSSLFLCVSGFKHYSADGRNSIISSFNNEILSVCGVLESLVRKRANRIL